MALVGALEKFDASNGNWVEYVEVLEQYFIANSIEDAGKKKGIFLTVIGSETYRLLRNLLAPTKPADKTLGQLVEALKNHLNPKPLVIAERYKFYHRCQNQGESLKDFLAEVRRMTEHCEFQNFLEEAIRDRFVCGMHMSNIRKRLLTEVNLTLERATSIALSMETSSRENELMVESEPVHKIENKGKMRCYRCNNPNHMANRCKFKESTCYRCKRQGHLAKVCTSTVSEKDGKDSPRPERFCKHCSENSTLKEEDDEEKLKYVSDWCTEEGENPVADEDDVYFVYKFQSVDPYKIELKINQMDIEFEIDTGSGKTIVPESVYKERFAGVNLQRTKLMLKTYSGECLNVLGKFVATLEHENHVVVAELYVVKGNGPALLGRDILSKIKLNWASVYTIKSVENDKLNKLKIKHKHLFSGKTGKLQGFQAKIHVKETATPRFCSPRKVPFAMQEAVTKELKRLEDEEIISPIAYSDWASPIVIVPKPDGQVRIFKSTVNVFIETEQYPLPNPDELFQKMQGGKKFSKLDLKTAYLQMELDQASKPYFVVNTHDGLKKFNRMPYGVTSGPAIFQRKLSSELKDINMTVVNIDDILVSGKDDAEHLENLSRVFEKLTELGLTLKTSKCNFFQSSIEYVGFILNEHGISANPEKIRAVLNAPEPNNVGEVQSFLGAVNYYGKFLKHMSSIASPLYQLLKKDTS